jgi:uncharacterized protein YukE
MELMFNMAKYVCDFDQVIATGEKMIEASEELETSVTNYSSLITNNLSSWSGVSKTTFEGQCNGQIELCRATALSAKNIGEYLKNAALQIQTLDDNLATLSI